MLRTSHTHPLQIAEVCARADLGRVGITFCPGKKQPSAQTGAWDRDLALDLDAVRDWGAAAVLTLVEDHEIRELKVERLGDEVRARHMAWLHAPIPDVSVPTAAFESAWAEIGGDLRSRLRSGFDVVVHCKGGLGRAGTIAARLLVELGMEPREAIKAVRTERPGAIETAAQEAYVMNLRPVSEPTPATDGQSVRDRARGALLGLACGDAVGTTLEFKPRDSYPLLTDMIGGGPFGLKPGGWTDDTAMALALAESLADRGELDEQDLLARFHDWWRKGTYSCTGSCFDIGITTSQALSRWERTQADVCGSTDPMSAGNGSLMRLAPVAISFFDNRSKLRDAAARQSRTTHAAAEAVDACVVYAELLADAIAGASRDEVLRSRAVEASPEIARIAAGSWRGLKRSEVKGSGYVVRSMEAALWSVGRSGSFEEAVLTAANLGDDADTTAAIAGQLAGALYGESGIPAGWLDKLAWAGRLRDAADRLLGVSAR